MLSYELRKKLQRIEELKQRLSACSSRSLGLRTRLVRAGVTCVRTTNSVSLRQLKSVHFT